MGHPPAQPNLKTKQQKTQLTMILTYSCPATREQKALGRKPAGKRQECFFAAVPAQSLYKILLQKYMQ